MGRLIDADELREDILHDNTFDDDTINYYLDKVDGMETTYDAEYKPVKKAEYGQYSGICRCGKTVFDCNKYCSECGTKLDWNGNEEGVVKDE